MKCSPDDGADGLCIPLNEQDSILDQKGHLEDLEVEAGTESRSTRQTDNGFQLQADTGRLFLLKAASPGQVATSL